MDSNTCASQGCCETLIPLKSSRIPRRGSECFQISVLNPEVHSGNAEDDSAHTCVIAQFIFVIFVDLNNF